MKKKGRKIYVPPLVLVEVEDIMREDEVNKRADAFNKFVEYARVGREIKRIAALDFSKAIPLPPIPKKNKKRGFFLNGS